MIFLTGIRQPERGAIFMAHCSICGRITFTLSEFACKPKDGDLWKVELCVEHPLHNVIMTEQTHFLLQ